MNINTVSNVLGRTCENGVWIDLIEENIMGAAR
jgi:hypothetical protein